MTWDSPEILVVDDSVTDQVRTSGLIKRFVPCADVSKASNCSEAETQLNHRSFDLIVTDLVMPGCDGRDLLDVIQRLPKAPAVILVTSQGNERVAAECLRRGAVAYLRKQNLAEDLEPALRETQATIRENSLHDRLMARVLQTGCEFEIDSDLSQIQALSNFLLQRLTATTTMSAQHLQKVIGSVREALLNAHFHGNMHANDSVLQRSRTDYMAVAQQHSSDAAFADCRIRLIMEHKNDQLHVTIRDGGKGFDVASAVHQSPPVDDRGAGIRQMLSSMTAVSWNDVGNEVTLINDSAILRASAAKANSGHQTQRGPTS
ncbi:MAG: response regulator [Fuerstiella sp.]